MKEKVKPDVISKNQKKVFGFFPPLAMQPKRRNHFEKKTGRLSERSEFLTVFKMVS
jgi:hypothetical protein